MTFFISLPLFIIIFAGWLFRRLELVDENWTRILNAFAYNVSLPALVIASLWKIDFFNIHVYKYLTFSLISLLFFSLVIFGILSITKLKTDLKSSLFLAIITGNTIYMGFPLVEMGFGQKYFATAAIVGNIYLALPILLSILIIRYWHSKHHNLFKEVLEFIKNPLTISIITGFLLSLVKINLELLKALEKAVSMLGQTASPVALFILGNFLHRRFQARNIGLAIIISASKMILFPLATILTALLIYKVPDIRVPFLLSSMPVAVTTFIIAQRFKLHKTIVGTAILVSTIFSMVITPTILAIFR